jgi:hypothetical protein
VSTLEHVAYASEAVTDFPDDKVRALLAGARAKNAAVGLTGMLLLIDRSFFQVLEGAPDAVASLYEKIERDPRHKRIVKLIQEPIERRDFEDWSMGLARVSSKELASVPGFRDFVATGRSLDGLGEGMARRLLHAFRAGSWRARVGTYRGSSECEVSRRGVRRPGSRTRSRSMIATNAFIRKPSNGAGSPFGTRASSMAPSRRGCGTCATRTPSRA